MREKIRHQLKSLASFQEPPHRLALAFGLGILLGILPGTGVVAAAFCAAIFRLNFSLMVAGAFLTNPLTAPLVYVASFFLGQWLLGSWLPSQAIPRLLLGTVVGNLILAMSLAVMGYLFCFGMAAFFQARRRSTDPHFERMKKI